VERETSDPNRLTPSFTLVVSYGSFSFFPRVPGESFLSFPLRWAPRVVPVLRGRAVAEDCPPPSWKGTALDSNLSLAVVYAAGL